MKMKQYTPIGWLGFVLMLFALNGHAQPVVTNIAAGLYRSFFIMGDGSLWGMGENGSGALGINTYTTTNVPVEIVSNGVIAAASGGFHSLFIKSDGSLWVMGNNQYGQLGDGTLNRTNQPEKIMPSNVVAVAAGVYHSLFLKGDGTLWGMGYNHDGQLGDGSFGSTNQSVRPELIDSNVMAVSAGNYHSLYQKTDYSFWGMGYNAQGALGTGNDSSVYEPVEILSSVFGFVGGGNHTVFFHNYVDEPNLGSIGDNSYGEFGDGTYNNSAVPELNTNFIVEFLDVVNLGCVTTGSDHTLFLDGDNYSLNGMGRNDFGQLGNGTYMSTNMAVGCDIDYVQTMSAGAYHSMFLKYDGSLWITGYNADGELGDGTYMNVNMPNLVTPGNVMVNGGFETGDFTGWTFPVTGHQDQIVSIANGGSYAAQFGDIFLGGFGGSTESIIAQTVPTQPGASYLLSFWINGVTNSSFNASWNGAQLIETSVPINEYAEFGWTNFQFVVNATGTNTVLQFQFPGVFNHAATMTGLDNVSVTPLPPGFNKITAQRLGGGLIQLSYMGRTWASYALDRTFSLTPPNWVPQSTNSVGANGLVVFTDTPNPATNNFWRIRQVQ